MWFMREGRCVGTIAISIARHIRGWQAMNKDRERHVQHGKQEHYCGYRSCMCGVYTAEDQENWCVIFLMRGKAATK